MAPSAASFTTLLISSTDVARLAVNVRSTSETLIVGMRTAKPSSLPLSSGSTRPTDVLVIDVGQALVVRVRVDRRHQAVDDADLVVEHLRERRKAVRGARRVRDDRVLFLQYVVVNA